MMNKKEGNLIDPYAEMINKINYIPVSSPSDDIVPLKIVLIDSNGEDSKKGELFGPLANSLVGSHHLPKIEPNKTVANFENGKISKVDSKFNINFLKNIFSRLIGSSVKTEANYQKAETIKIFFENVRIDSVDKEELNAYLDHSKLKPSSLLKKTLTKTKKNAMIIYEIIKSNSFIVAAFDETGGALGVDFEAIKNEVEASGHISISKGVDKTLSYKGDKFLTFGFKAVDATLTSDGKFEIGFLEDIRPIKFDTEPSPDDYDKHPEWRPRIVKVIEDAQPISSGELFEIIDFKA